MCVWRVCTCVWEGKVGGWIYLLMCGCVGVWEGRSVVCRLRNTYSEVSLQGLDRLNSSTKPCINNII